MSSLFRIVRIARRRGGRFAVFLEPAPEGTPEGEPAFDLGPTCAVRLVVGADVDAATLAALRDDDGRLRAHDLALGCLARRARSRREVDRYLAGKGVAPAHREHALDRLAAAGLLNDAEYARSFVESRDRARPKGARALRAELGQRGVARADIDAALADPDRDEADAAVRAGRKHLSHLRGVDDRQQFRQRLGNFLMRRGFGWDTVKGAVEQLWQERDA